jgi:hypothetical protein
MGGTFDPKPLNTDPIMSYPEAHNFAIGWLAHPEATADPLAIVEVKRDMSDLDSTIVEIVDPADPRIRAEIDGTETELWVAGEHAGFLTVVSRPGRAGKSGTARSSSGGRSASWAA